MAKHEIGYTDTSVDSDEERETPSKRRHVAQEEGTAHRVSAEEAREAGRKGGNANQEKGRH
ncbi:hypothetical protein ACFV0T_42050 [Streptomyces sp. NPDC059582]|uniref:hypothetical protein n=1 Tax=Streptomyces sp. NPDC059582 TaxID=3346875 RepID=UPI0036A19F5F